MKILISFSVALIIGFSSLFAENSQKDSIQFFNIETKIYDVLMSQPDSALVLIQKQQEIAIHNTSLLLKGRYESNLGGYFWITGKLDMALLQFMKALGYAEKAGIRSQMAAQYNNIAIIYNDLENYSECVDYNLKSLAIGHELNSGRDLIISYNNLGNAFMKMEQNILADAYLDSCIELCDSLGNVSIKGLAYSNKAAIALNLNRYKEAIEWGSISLELANENNATKTAIHAQLSMAEAYLNLDASPEAESHALACLSSSKDIGFIEGLEKAYLLLSNIAAFKDDESSHLKYREQHILYRDSIFNKKTASRIAQLERQVSEEKHEKELAEQNLKALALDKIQQRQKLVYRLSIAGIVVLLIFIWLLYIHYKNIAQRRIKELIVTRLKKNLIESELENSRLKNDELNLALDEKEKELLQYIYTLERKQQLEKEIREKIKKIQEPNGALQELKILLAQNKTTEKDWDEFILRFEQVHKDFFKKLHQFALKLTPTDLKICAFLKMNLSSKQIAKLLNIESSSVDMARYRLRKNLVLAKEDNLIDFIHRI